MELSDGNFQVGNMELGGTQEKVPILQSSSFSAKGIQREDWMGHMKSFLQEVSRKETFKKEMPWRETRRVTWNRKCQCKGQKGTEVRLIAAGEN